MDVIIAGTNPLTTDMIGFWLWDNGCRLAGHTIVFFRSRNIQSVQIQRRQGGASVKDVFLADPLYETIDKVLPDSGWVRIGSQT
jgi:hypothetical protein